MEERESTLFTSSDPLLTDIRILIDILIPLVNSYRLLVGAADEFNGITLAHKSDLEAAIKRADEMGDIIDDIDKKLGLLIKQFIRSMGSHNDYIFDKDILFKSSEGADLSDS